jgi:hypothetical protein
MSEEPRRGDIRKLGLFEGMKLKQCRGVNRESGFHPELEVVES